MTTIGYARVSTPDQCLDLQLDALVGAGCTRVHTDTASGALAARPGLEAALANLNAGDTLVVWRLDRLGRSLPHLVATVEELHARAVALRSLHEAIDTTTATGRLMLNVFAALAAFERDLVAERTAAGLAAARRRGTTLGRPSVWSQDKAEAASVMLAGGASVAAVARALGVSRASVYRHAQP
ncbi:DNA-invertase hin [Actinomyces bovis]|uniref:DNA-invertase hin n=1 Tax=Actinomyces bovis TaxID=1658 RepID=A0ABY1VL53_9ACTO|nr:recombinase family protein [Actinomyces bovis]SPT52745.1 DNA-invertase hin [Actinomyces bovis]VEG54735.1 DNA-invertase hin [Actinomyces israelii]